jgi:hypothetical protein
VGEGGNARIPTNITIATEIIGRIHLSSIQEHLGVSTTRLVEYVVRSALI